MNRLRRLVMPFYGAYLTSPTSRAVRRGIAELRRAGGPHRVRYFHQPDDPYSHLAAQILPQLVERYDVQLEPHLVGPPSDAAAPERDRLTAYSRKDAADIAPHYGLHFPANATAPDAGAVERATRLLAGAGEHFVRDASRIGEALWSGRLDAFDALGDLPMVTAESARAACTEGSDLRERTGHYLGATFHYGGEWYWGVDRLHYLEDRLQRLGLRRPGQPTTPIVLPPRPPSTPLPSGRRLRLEYFASLRSPYSGIAMQRVFDLPERLPVDLVLRPVLPMVMRGLPVPRNKFLYILKDAKREAETAGEPFGWVCDPVGRPIERAFSLFPWARELGRAAALLHAFTQAAFARGVDTHTDRGLRDVVERAGLSWEAARPHLDSEAWREELEENRRVMFEAGLWGVPSFRVLDGEEQVLATWGQDRLWLVESAIRRTLASDTR